MVDDAEGDEEEGGDDDEDDEEEELEDAAEAAGQGAVIDIPGGAPGGARALFGGGRLLEQAHHDLQRIAQQVNWLDDMEVCFFVFI